MCGCLSVSNGSPVPIGVGTELDAGGPPSESIDGAVVVDGSTPPIDAGVDADDAATVITIDAGFDAGRPPTLVTGLGSGVVAHSAHFTLVTKTGSEPGGSGVKRSATFTVISGAAPAATQ